MGEYHLPSAMRQPHKRHTVRLENLERAVTASQRPPPPPVGEKVEWSAPVVLAVTSGRWYADSAKSFRRLLVSLGTAGTTTTTVVLKVNGTTVATANLTSGVNLVDTGIVVDLGELDYMTATVTAVGANATQLTVQVLP